MLASTLLIKKREGHALSDAEIQFLIDGYCTGEIADYQMSALAMAICLKGMNQREIVTLTREMLESGDRLPRDGSSDKPRVDKHSTGGLGDKVSIVLAPLLASCEVQVPMISGRGLGLTGGTLDKLESIDGFRTDLSPDHSLGILQNVGAFIVGASERIAPADRKLYALRDVTGTVESAALITASILSKKLAADLDALVMDVKVGGGAFMRTMEEARELAESLARVGMQAGLPTSALITDMDQPLGHSIGNAIEINESMEVLQGVGGEVRDLTIELCAELLVQVRVSKTLDEARVRLAHAIDSGSAMERFERMVAAQGGRLDYPLQLAPAHSIIAKQRGFISHYDCETIGEVIIAMGGGRRRKTDKVDHRVGVSIHGRIGDAIEKEEPILTLYCPNHLASEYLIALESAVKINRSQVPARPLIIERFGSQHQDQSSS